MISACLQLLLNDKEREIMDFDMNSIIDEGWSLVKFKVPM